MFLREWLFLVNSSIGLWEIEIRIGFEFVNRFFGSFRVLFR